MSLNHITECMVEKDAKIAELEQLIANSDSNNSDNSIDSNIDEYQEIIENLTVQIDELTKQQNKQKLNRNAEYE